MDVLNLNSKIGIIVWIHFSVGGEEGGLCFNDVKFKFNYNYCKPAVLNLWSVAALKRHDTI